MTSELRAEPGEAWARDEGQAVHPGRHRRAPEARSSYREVFAIGEFRALWSAQVLSFAGDQFAQVAIAILVYGRTHSPFLTALAYALTYLPPIAGGPLLSGLAGAGGAYQLAAAAAFVQALRPDTRARAFGVAQSGLYAVQGLGILAAGAMAQLIGAPLAVGLA